MEYSMCSDKGIITTSSLSSSSSRSASPSSSSSPSTNYPPSPPPPAAVTSPPESSSSSSSPDSPPPDLPPAAVTSLPSPPATTPVLVISSCAACKYLGLSCDENCVLAACFPPNDLVQFIAVHRVFGATNIIKLLQELPEYQRPDAVTSLAYEANARLRDPVYGCAGAICQLHKQVSDLQAQLAEAQAELVNMQCQQANLAALVCTEMGQSPQASPHQSLYNFTNIPMSFLDENNNFGPVWEPLWT